MNKMTRAIALCSLTYVFLSYPIGWWILSSMPIKNDADRGLAALLLLFSPAWVGGLGVGRLLKALLQGIGELLF